MKISLFDEDVAKVIRELPEVVVSLLERYPNQLFLAGGFIRATLAGETPKDVDLFGTSNVLLFKIRHELEEKLLSIGRDYTISCTPNATTFNVKDLPESIQFIERWVYEKPEDLINSFDFTISQAAMTYRKEGDYDSVCSLDFYGDLATKTLRYTSPNRLEELAGSLQRVMKFVAKGYTISNDSLSRVISRAVSNIEEEHIETILEEQTMEDKVSHRLYNRLSRCNGNKY